MRSLVKPPILNKLTAKFFKYDWKRVFTKIYSFWVWKMLVYEKSKVYLIMNKNLFHKTVKNLILKFEGYSFQTFFTSLFLHISPSDFEFPQKPYFFAIQTLLDYLWLFSWKDLSLNWTRYLFFKSVIVWRPMLWFFYFKDLAYTFDKQIYQGDFTKLRSIANIFFYNIIFYSLVLGLYEHKISKNAVFRKKIYYFGDAFMESILCGKYYETYSLYNWYLTLQTGVLKNKKFYVNWNYLFTTTTQLLWARKVFIFKFFFWNNYFWFFTKIKRWFKLDKNIKRKNIDGIYIWDRSAQILPFFINKIFYIHNGVKFFWVWILPGMVGYKLGQFSFTRKIHAWNVNLWAQFKNLF